MSKVVTISLSQVGGDISTVDIYHTSITGSNLLASNVSASILTSTGVNLTVEDSVDTFFALVNDGGACDLTTGSFSSSFFRPYVRYFHVEAVGSSGATVEISYPTLLGPTTGSLDLEVDFRNYSYVTITADETPGYPVVSTFDGWYTQASGGTLHSLDSTLTITLGTYTTSDSFYARYS